MHDPKPAISAMANALSSYFGGAKVTTRDRTHLRHADGGYIYEWFDIHFQAAVHRLAVTDGRLASLSNTHHIEAGHPYKDDDELSKALLDEMEHFNVLGLVRAVNPPGYVVWDSNVASMRS